MHALVTGGAGFIGSHLVELLLAQGHGVDAVDDLSTGGLDNLAAVRDHPRLGCHVGSATDPSLLSPLVDRCDVIFHLAASVGVRLIVDDPMRTIMNNVSTVETVLRLATARRQLVLLTSSSEVYGKRQQVPFREDDDLILGPPAEARWSYGCAKALGEHLAMAYRKAHGLPVVIARLFNTVGPRQTGRYGMVVPRFVEAAVSGRPLTVYGDGSQSRCFAHVRDVVCILAALAARPEAVGQVVNVGSDEEITIAALARLIKTLTASRSEVVFVPYAVAYGADLDDMPRRLPDLRKLERLIGERPRTPLQQTLQSLVAGARAAA